MAYVHLVIVAAFVQFIIYGMRVSVMRSKHGVKAPAQSGHPEFERMNRIHLNTLEQLVIWTPLMMVAAQYRDPRQVAMIGLLFLVGREVYRMRYLADPSSRTLGFVLGGVSTALLLVIVVWGALRSLL